MVIMVARLAALAIAGAEPAGTWQCAYRSSQFTAGIVIAPFARTAVAAPRAASATRRAAPAVRAGASTMVLSH